MKKHYTKVLAGIITLLILDCVEKENNPIPKISPIDSISSDFRGKYNAVPEVHYEDYIYTKQFIDSLVIPKRNIVLKSWWRIDDFMEEDNLYFIVIESYPPEITFRISCNDTEFNELYKIMTTLSNYPKAVYVVRINQIEKVQAIRPIVGGGYGDLEIESYLRFIANAELIDFSIVPD
jgi:hypothetical protein